MAHRGVGPHEVKGLGGEGEVSSKVFRAEVFEADSGGWPHVLLADVRVKEGHRDPGLKEP